MSLGISSDTPDFTVIETGRMPLDLVWTDKGDLCVLYTDGVIVYSSDGVCKAELDLSGLPGHSFNLGESLMVSVYSNTVLGFDKTVNIYGSDARLISSFSLEGELISSAVSDSKVCLLFEDRAVLIDPIQGKIYEASLKPNAKKVVFYGDDVVVCYSGSAEQVKLSEIT